MAASVSLAVSEKESSTRSTVSCGPNAVFMFLILCGVDPSEKSIDSIECEPKGASLLDLKRFAESYGIYSDVRSYGPSEFRRMPLPAICQTQGTGTSLHLKHFLVAYDVDRTGIHTLDATTGKTLLVRTDRIGSYLSGYVLVPKPSLMSAVLNHQDWICFVLLVANIILLRERAPDCSVQETKSMVADCQSSAQLEARIL